MLGEGGFGITYIGLDLEQGRNTDFNKVLGLMISNGLVALSGALLSQYQGFADLCGGMQSIGTRSGV